MKNTLKLLLALRVAVTLTLTLALASVASAQTATTFTTLAAALSGGSGNNRVTVTATTGINASTTSTNVFSNTGGASYCLIDHELVLVASVDTTNKILTVRRGIGGTAAAHPNGQVILCGTGGNFNPNTGSTTGVFLGTNVPHGTCTASNNQFLPVVTTFPAAGTSDLYNCNDSIWVAQTLPNEVPPTLTRYCAPPGLQTLSLLTTFGTSGAPMVVGNNTTPVNGTWFFGSIEIPKTIRVKGISVLNGSVAATDKYTMAIWRADGTLLGNTLAAGTLAASIAQFQDVDLTAPILVTGPARYWVGVQLNGTTARFATVNLTPGATTAGLGAFIGMLGSSVTGTLTVFPNLSTYQQGTGTLAALDARPSSLIANTAPINCVYQP